MRIDINNLMAQQLAAERAAKSNTKSKASSSSAPEDQATFSESSLSATALIQGAMTEPPTRQEKVAALRDVVQAGQYKLDPVVMADAMLREVGE